MNYSIKTLNSISARGLSKLPESYEVGPHVDNADAWLVRSANLHSVEIPDSVLAISRAGAGTNTIPVNQLSGRGVVVFNTPGSNANAVKELVLAGILLGARNILPAAAFARQLTGDDNEINAAVEAGKKQFVGWELPGRTLGVIGLGEVGVQVANAAEALGMKVLGYDPAITIRHAWQLSSHVTRAASIDEVFRRADVLTVHVPLIEATQGLVNAERLALMKQRALVLNFSRAGIVDSPAMVAALESGSIRGYVCDFPSAELLNRPKVVALPHLGASTVEAEENSAAMAVNELRDFLENGNISNSVNFPDAVLAREPDTTRIVVANVNVPNMVAEISALIGDAGINITNLLNKSRGELAWTMIDVRGPVTDALRSSIEQIEGVLRVRVIEP
ncbi:MAG: 3-phosphoglycerate dehydrogenase [Propionibacteriaceae bacterium]|jgi:D-3-phosphoglycerate dehydrogenase|uniref:D-3-phosphoglycerate dehydrogenase n=1 Tax=Brooklawnia propionicigenes TaxID=3041175 RepID=A0AAN0MGN2_9ACTN|nr:3-phosphoglycerate dehydrogenase family protein [Brooklawnia sp. SH051]MCB0884889.1 3-phosphoglycerate dehydrogenase [Propionibacteriaceae bacterium]MEA5119987.1 3-phosphoglycerate dehydrogenase family protein [Propionibacterium sp.]BEH02142.1 phosphoglycerate dehydrogenase [Brooklawnia sp. SH051]